MEVDGGFGALELPSRRSTVAAWLFGLLLFAAVLGVLVHFSELEELANLLRRLRPEWLLTAFGLQCLTYVCAAAVWQVALVRQGCPITLKSLMPLALAMLFANQAFPSGGVSGSIVVVRALERRRFPATAVMAALLVGLVTTYAAYVPAVIISLAVLRVYHAVSVSLLVGAGIFALSAVGVPSAIIWYRQSIAPHLQRRLHRLGGLGAFLMALGTARADLFRDRQIFIRAVTLQLIEILLDAATLQVMLLAVQVKVAPSAVFGSFVMASTVSRVVPVPLGLGPFEAVSVAMLHLVGVPIEAALTATLLLRGFTLWLPMIPGLWFARQELWAHPQ